MIMVIIQILGGVRGRGPRQRAVRALRGRQHRGAPVCMCTRMCMIYIYIYIYIYTHMCIYRYIYVYVTIGYHIVVYSIKLYFILSLV